jgi:hypothetical protein
LSADLVTVGQTLIFLLDYATSGFGSVFYLHEIYLKIDEGAFKTC